MKAGWGKSNDLYYFDSLEEVPAVFIGRIEELGKIANAFFQEGARVVGVVGKSGVGKTVLIRQFIKQHGAKFPGGVYHYPNMPAIDTWSLSLGFIPELHQPFLLVIEEYHALSEPDMGYLLSTILKERPSAQILFSSQRLVLPSKDSSIDETIILEKFSAKEQAELRKHLQVKTEGSKTGGVEPFIKYGVLDPDGNPLSPDSKPYQQIITSVKDVNDELLRRLARNPELLYELTPQKFEEVVAELLHHQGFEVEMTRLSKDEGVDIFAVSRTPLGSSLFAVQCKKYMPKNKVGVEVIRELYGLVDLNRYTSGVVVTTSFFTKGAEEFRDKSLYRIHLKDYIAIQQWLNDIHSSTRAK